MRRVRPHVRDRDGDVDGPTDLLRAPVPRPSRPKVRRGAMTLSGPAEGARLRTLSLGAGIQSTTMALMAAHGEIDPMPDVALFADTGEEPAPIYEQVRWLASGNVLPFPVETVGVGRRLGDGLLDRRDGSGRFASVPFFTAGGGQARRQCTREFKIAALQSAQRSLMGYQPRQRIRETCEVWIGFTTDELVRCGAAFEPWVVNRYPLIEKRMSLLDCIAWLERHDYPVPMRSQCVCCPYRSNREWYDLRTRDPDGFERACELDDAVRHSSGMREAGYLHHSRRPLRSVDLSAHDDPRLDLGCEGECGT